jgi:putative transposase
MKKTFLYKAKINQETETNCFRWLELCRILYNLGLEQRITVYNQHKESISCYDQVTELPNLKAEFPEFKAVGSQVLQDVLERLDRAFKAFFKRIKQREKAGFPRFKSKYRYDSFTLKQAGWQLSGRYLYIKNVGRFKMFLSRPIEGTIKTVTIRKTSSREWFIAFSCDNVIPKAYPVATGEIGIDVGIETFLRDSNDRTVDNPKFYRVSEKLLKRRQRSLCRKKKGSTKRNQTRILVAKAHEKIANQRNHFLHRTANYYLERFKTIYIEDLNIKGMVRNRYLAKSISDCSWGMFFNILSGKVEETDKRVIKVPPKNTTQICSSCGFHMRKSLAQRVHHCPNCNLKIHRDFNSAINIKILGQRVQALTSAMAVVA